MENNHLTDVRQFVVQTIQEICKPERPDLTDHDKSLLAGDLDSLDFASVLLAMEDEYGIAFGEIDLETVSSINKLVAFIERSREA